MLPAKYESCERYDDGVDEHDRFTDGKYSHAVDQHGDRICAVDDPAIADNQPHANANKYTTEHGRQYRHIRKSMRHVHECQRRERDNTDGGICGEYFAEFFITKIDEWHVEHEKQ